MIWIILVIIIIFILTRITYREPRVYPQMISEDECRHIIELSRSQLSTSSIIDKNVVDENVRKSDTAWLDPQDDKIVERVVRRCLKNCDRPLRNCEQLQVVRYKPGGYYNPHYDNPAFFDIYSDMELRFNPRMYTFIIALNDDYKGGHTIFPNLNKKYKLQTGDVLRFDNLNNYGFPSSQSLHGGDKVEEGEKWICNVWPRMYNLSTPVH